MQIIVEGWRFVPHSFAIANQFQLLEFLRRSDLEVYHREMPYFQDDWQRKSGLFDRDREEQLKNLPTPPANFSGDATLRMFMPYDFTPSKSRRTVVFATTEWGIVQKVMLSMMGVHSIWDAHHDNDTIIVTPSNWSKTGFLRHGAVSDRIVVIPHGVDTEVYRPLPEMEREYLRQQWGLDDCFVFLNISIMTWNKGIRPLLKAFAAIVDRYPQARLILKGSDAIRRSRDMVIQDLREMLTPAQIDRVLPCIAYIGDSLPASEMARLHQIADAYIAPYLAEGFNMPVLEAAACGLPVICTKGGPTDDFTTSEFALYIDSALTTMEMNHETRFYLHPDLDSIIEMMSKAIESPGFLDSARRFSPGFVRDRYTWAKIVDRWLEILR